MNREQSKRRLKEYEEMLEQKEREGHLKHHGVKGMKWGVRRYQPYTDSNKRKGGKGGVFKGAKDKLKSHNQKNVDRSLASARKRKAKGGITSKVADMTYDKSLKRAQKNAAKKKEKQERLDAARRIGKEVTEEGGSGVEAFKRGREEAIARREKAKKDKKQAKAVKKKKEKEKKPSRKVSLTITDKEGNADTFTMSREAAEKFEKRAKEQGFKTSVKDVVKKKKLKQSDNVNELVNDQFLKHGIDLGEFYDREA